MIWKQRWISPRNVAQIPVCQDAEGASIPRIYPPQLVENKNMVYCLYALYDMQAQTGGARWETRAARRARKRVRNKK